MVVSCRGRIFEITSCSLVFGITGCSFAQGLERAKMVNPTSAGELAMLHDPHLSSRIHHTPPIPNDLTAPPLRVFRAKDPVVRALIQGGTSSVLGIEATSEPQESNRKGPANSTAGVSPSLRDVSTIAMIPTGAAGTVLVNIPWVRSALLSIALGSTVVGAEVPVSP